MFADPLAIPILGRAGAGLLERRLEPAEARAWRGMRASIAARSRFSEDLLHQAVRNGTSQFVLLGAGLDTFGVRNPHRNVRVFEVDHPSTQAFKRTQLEDASIEIPDSLTFVPLDFGNQAAIDALGAAGFRCDAPAVFSWLGVTMYLEPAVLFEMLASIAAGTAPGTVIVFDYIVPPTAVADSVLRARYEALAERVAAIGEPWLSYFEPQQVAEGLRSCGFTQIEDWDGAALNTRYFARRTDGLAVRPTVHLIAARV